MTSGQVLLSTETSLLSICIKNIAIREQFIISNVRIYGKGVSMPW